MWVPRKQLKTGKFSCSTTLFHLLFCVDIGSLMASVNKFVFFVHFLCFLAFQFVEDKKLVAYHCIKRKFKFGRLFSNSNMTL